MSQCSAHAHVHTAVRTLSWIDQGDVEGTLHGKCIIRLRSRRVAQSHWERYLARFQKTLTSRKSDESGKDRDAVGSIKTEGATGYLRMLQKQD